MKLLLFATLLVLYYMPYCAGISPDELQYIVAIDAGSKGSRAGAYKFHMNRLDKKITLDADEKVAMNNGGLGSYINNPAQGVEKIKELLESIKKQLQLSPEVLAKTPVILGGTGGLRNLQPQEAEKLLVEVRKMLKKSGFSVKDSVASIINGDDEGIFAWFAVNYLLGRWGMKNTVTALDVGGSSIELSFPVRKPIKDRLLNDHVYTLSTSMPKSKTDVISISYSNLGTCTMSKTVFGHGNPDGATDFHSICMHPKNKPFTFQFGTKSYNVSGLPNKNSTVDFNACMKLVKEKTLNFLTPKPTPLADEKEIFVFSEFYFQLRKTGLINPEGGQVILNDILLRAKKACSVQDDQNPIMCYNLIYIYVLLHDGYGLKSETKVNFHLKLNGHYISWVLANAYDHLVGLKREKKIK